MLLINLAGGNLRDIAYNKYAYSRYSRWKEICLLYGKRKNIIILILYHDKFQATYLRGKIICIVIAMTYQLRNCRYCSIFNCYSSQIHLIIFCIMAKGAIIFCSSLTGKCFST